MFGIEWRDAWGSGNASNEGDSSQVWTGYWSLVAVLDRGEFWPGTS